MITVGMLMIPNRPGVAGFWSMSIFRTLILAPSSPARSSTTGAIIRQGAHQAAQKSTSTGSFDCRTVASNSESLTLAMVPTGSGYAPSVAGRLRLLGGLGLLLRGLLAAGFDSAAPSELASEE